MMSLLRTLVSIVVAVHCTPQKFLHKGKDTCSAYDKGSCCGTSTCGYVDTECKPLGDIKPPQSENECADNTISGLIYGIRNNKRNPNNASTTCEKNTFVADWGSSGARIYLAHKSMQKDPASTFGSKIMIKEWLNVHSEEADIQKLVSILKQETAASAPEMMAILATAGARLRPNKSERVWSLLQEVNDRDPFLQQCNKDSNIGCRTLPGAEEAQYEFEAAYPAQYLPTFVNKHGKDECPTGSDMVTDEVSCKVAATTLGYKYDGRVCGNDLIGKCVYSKGREGKITYVNWQMSCQHTHASDGYLCQMYSDNQIVGMISAGGASLQVAFKVAAETASHAEDCVRMLMSGDEAKKYDLERASFNKIDGLFSLSFLSARRENEPSEFAVGGMNEMRAAFDRYYVLSELGVKEDFNKKWQELVQNESARQSFGNHPCLQGIPEEYSSGLDKYKASETKVSFDTAEKDWTGAGNQNLQYFANGWDAYITMLNGSMNPTTAYCRYWIREFIEQDTRMKTFRAGGCKDIAKQVNKWMLISNFHWNLQKYANKQQTGREMVKNWFENATASKYVPGQFNRTGHHDYFNQALTMEVLVQLGIFDDTATVQSKEAEWIDAASDHLQPRLAAGWLKDDECFD